MLAHRAGEEHPAVAHLSYLAQTAFNTPDD
jgi:hypothetical protein